MRRVVSILLVLLLANLFGPVGYAMAIASARQSQQTASETAPLTNKDILQMVKTGIASEIIVAKIKGSASNFDTSPATLQELKASGVPDAVLMAMVQASANPQPSGAKTRTQEVKIPDGTTLDIQLAYNISSETAKEGDLVSFNVVEPLIIEGTTVIERGAVATAHVVSAKKSGHWGKAGKLAWTMNDVIAADGTRVPLRMSKKMAGDSKGASVATGAIVTGVIFFPAAPLWGLKKGKNAVFQAGKRFQAFVHGDQKVQGKIPVE